jgi:hypothetical protein
MESVMKNFVKSVLWFLASALTFASTNHLLAQDADDAASAQAAAGYNQSYGTTDYREAPDLSTVAVSVSAKPIVIEQKASYATAGVSLRNRGAGNINISGLVGAPRVTLLYWAVITVGNPLAPDRTVNIQRLFPGASPVAAVPGAVVGQGPAPCWGPQGAVITVFRGVVPAAVASGNGSYQLTMLPGASGKVDGSDPWLGVPILPLLEGASLVMVGDGVGTVSVFDIGLSGKTFAPNPTPFTYTLNLPVVPSGRRMLFDNIGADGQHVAVANRLDVLSYSDETTTINGFPIAGPGSDYVDSDWNGSSGLPLPELWDDTGHDITIASQDPAGGPAPILNIVIKSPLGPTDCLTPIANVVEED